MMTGAGLQRDFRIKGYTTQNMVSPRLPLTVEDQRRVHEPQVANYFGKSSVFDPAKPRIDDSPMGMAYGDKAYDRGHPHPPPHRHIDNNTNMVEEGLNKICRHREDIDDDIKRMKQEKLRERMEKENDERKSMDQLNKTFPWDRQSKGHGAPRDSGNNRRQKFLETDFTPRTQPGYKDEYRLDYNVSKKRETDLFLDVLGGVDGKQLRKNGSPKLADPRFERQQNEFMPASPGRQIGADGGVDQRDLQEQRRRIDHLRSQIDELKANSPAFGKQDGSYGRQQDAFNAPNQNNAHRRSLDLENTRGGAGAPVKDNRGKNVTRRPITLMRNDYGDSKIKEDVPGNVNWSFLEEDNRPYDPWGGAGGGAPIRDRDGHVKTQVFGNFEGRCSGSGEVRRHKRRQEVLYNELREVAKQQQENKNLQTRYMKAPIIMKREVYGASITQKTSQGELADVMMQYRVGRPKRNEITGEIEQHHLPNSDVSLVKMNHQPKPVIQKKQYHDELMQAAEERQHTKQLEKLKEKQESNAHFTRMDDLWGHWGGGAPKNEVVRKKANLFNSIHYPEYSPDSKMDTDPNLPPTGLGSFERSPNQGYQKLYLNNDDRQHPSPHNSPRYVKATVNSSHKNMFDAPDDPRKLTRPGGETEIPPFATGGVY